MMISCHWNRLVKVKVISAKKFFKVNKKDKKIPLEDDTEWFDTDRENYQPNHLGMSNLKF